MEVRVNMEQDRLNLLIAEVYKLKIEVCKLQQILHRSSNNHQTESSRYDELVNNAVDHYCKSMSEYRKSSKQAQLISIDELKTKHNECKTAALEFFEHSKSKIGELYYETLEEKLKKDIDFKYDEFSTNVQLLNKEIVNAELEKKFRTGLCAYHNMMADFFVGYNWIELNDDFLTQYHKFCKAVAENHVKEFDGHSKYEFEADSLAHFLKKLDEEIVVMHQRFSNYYDKREEVAKNVPYWYDYRLRLALSNFIKGTKNYYNIPSDVFECNLQTLKREVELVLIKEKCPEDEKRQLCDFLDYSMKNMMEHKEQLDKAFPERNYPEISEITPVILF